MVGKDDEAWQAIVANYGDRVELGPETEPAAEQRAEPEPGPDELDEHDDLQPPEDPEDTFVPPQPPPVPRPSNDRLAAWIGVFGSPALVLLFVVLQVTIPGWLGLLLVVGFVGGFLYLVMRSPRSPRDPWDDGARV